MRRITYKVSEDAFAFKVGPYGDEQQHCLQVSVSIDGDERGEDLIDLPEGDWGVVKHDTANCTVTLVDRSDADTLSFDEYSKFAASTAIYTDAVKTEHGRIEYWEGCDSEIQPILEP